MRPCQLANASQADRQAHPQLPLRRTAVGRQADCRPQLPNNLFGQTTRSARQWGEITDVLWQESIFGHSLPHARADSRMITANKAPKGEIKGRWTFRLDWLAFTLASSAPFYVSSRNRPPCLVLASFWLVHARARMFQCPLLAPKPNSKNDSATASDERSVHCRNARPSLYPARGRGVESRSITQWIWKTTHRLISSHRNRQTNSVSSPLARCRWSFTLLRTAAGTTQDRPHAAVFRNMPSCQ